MNRRVGQLLVGVVAFVATVGTGATAMAEDVVDTGGLDKLVATNRDCAVEGDCPFETIVKGSIEETVRDCLDGCDPPMPGGGIMCAGAGAGVTLTSRACVPPGTP